MTGNYTVYNDLGKFEGSFGGCYTPWVNDYVVTNGYSSPVGVVFLGSYLSHYFRISHLLSSIYSYILVSDDPESFSSCYPLFLDEFFTCSNALAQPS